MSPTAADYQKSASRRRVLFILGPILAILLIIHLVSPSRTSGAGGSGLSGRGGSHILPGFGSRSSASRRTDAYRLNAQRKAKSAASALHGGGGTGPANFSEAPPFTFCPTFGEGDELGNVYGPEAILKTRSHVGSSERVRRVLRRAMAGLPITIGVLGGSVSSCHGLDATTAHPLGNPIGPNCYPHRLFAWLNDVFPHPANELTNGALRRTGTSYFGFCSEMHLPDRVDLIIVEFDTEDPHDATTLATTDLLIRSLLLRPDQPAVIMLGHFAPQMQGEHGFAGAEIWHSAVAQFYDVVHLSVKGFLYEEYLLNPQKVRQSYFLDPILANAKGHELLADTVIAYLESEVCQVWDAAALEADLAGLPMPNVGGGLPGGILGDDVGADGSRGSGGGSGAGGALFGGMGLRHGSDAGLDGEDAAAAGGKDGKDGAAGSGNNAVGMRSGRASYSRVPPFRIMDKPNSVQHFREIKPNCASANDLINPLPSSVFAGSGWQPVSPRPDDEDERHYWYTETPGSLLKIPVKVGAGDIAVYYLKGKQSDGWGTLLCWVDDNTGGAVELRGSWDRDYGQPTVTHIDKGVSRGAHYVVCELQGQSGIDTARARVYAVLAT